jgi:HAMP domain-containing protein
MSQLPESPTPTIDVRSGLSLNARLFIGVILITGVAIAILGYFFLSNQAQTANFITTFLTTTIQQQVEEDLLVSVNNEAVQADEFFRQVNNTVNLVNANLTTLLAQQAILGQGQYWDGRANLTQLSENQWGNGPDDDASILVPSVTPFTDGVVAEINTAVHLDWLAPHLLEGNSSLLAIYFVSKDGVTLYYPNIQLANLVGDFDARQRPYYLALAPDQNETAPPATYWSAPYNDAALNGLVETNAMPIYDAAGDFRGVVAADVLITTITDKVSAITPGESGYAFLIDSQGRFISLPDAARSTLGLEPAAGPADSSPEEIIENSIFDTHENVAKFAPAMLAGETGLSTFVEGDVTYYLAYAPITTTGYSLGLVVPVDELQNLSLTVTQRLTEEGDATTQLTIVILALVLLTALLFSYVLARVITRPLRELTEAAEAVAAGNLEVDVALTESGELGRLSLAFNKMTDQLQDLVANLEMRIAERTRAIETSMEVSRSLSTLLDQQQLLAQVVTLVQTTFNYYHVHIYVTDPATGNLRLASGTGEAGQAMLVGNHQVRKGQGLIGLAAARGEIILAPDVRQTTEWLPNPLLPDTKTEVALPIKIGQEVLGVLDVQHDKVNGISRSEADLLYSIANQIGVALRNARLFEQATQRANQEAVVNQIGQEIQFAPDIESVLQIAAQRLGERLGVQRAIVQLSVQPQEKDNGRSPSLATVNPAHFQTDDERS